MPTLKAKNIHNSRKATTPTKIAKAYVFPPTHFRTNIKTSENQAVHRKPVANKDV